MATTLVTLSVLDAPESDAAWRSGALGAAAVPSMVTARLGEGPLRLPAASDCLAFSIWVPAASVELVIVQLPEESAVAVPSTVVPLVS